MLYRTHTSNMAHGDYHHGVSARQISRLGARNKTPGLVNWQTNNYAVYSLFNSGLFLEIGIPTLPGCYVTWSMVCCSHAFTMIVPESHAFYSSCFAESFPSIRLDCPAQNTRPARWDISLCTTIPWSEWSCISRLVSCGAAEMVVSILASPP